MKLLSIFSTLLLVTSFAAQAKLVTSEVDYSLGKTKMRGYLAFDDAQSGKRPGALMIHNWMGITDETKKQAHRLAELGYVVFAADVYGADVRPADAKEAAALSSSYKQDRKKLRAHLEAALKTLRSQKNVDSSKIAALGYCFGGTAAIELARAGAKIKGAISFHGGLDSPTPKDGKNIKTPILALHGADDPYVSAEDLAAFEKEMRDNKVDWRLIKYGNSVHSFTEVGAGNDNSKGAAYNALADARSWEDMKLFLADTLK